MREAIHSKIPRSINSGSLGFDMAVFQIPLTGKTWPSPSWFGRSRKNFRMFDLLLAGLVSFITQKKHSRQGQSDWIFSISAFY